MRLGRAVVTCLLVCLAPACAGVPQSTVPRDPFLDESSFGEPPEDWSSAVQFAFADSTLIPRARFSTRIEFNDGLRNRTITVADTLLREFGGPYTWWYRLRPGRDTSIIYLRFTLEHEGGARTVAVYPLPVSRDKFIAVYADVYTRVPHRDGSPLSATDRSYPVPPGTAALPSDSLWIGYSWRGRYCFHCPT